MVRMALLSFGCLGYTTYTSFYIQSVPRSQPAPTLRPMSSLQSTQHLIISAEKLIVQNILKKQKYSHKTKIKKDVLSALRTYNSLHPCERYVRDNNGKEKQIFGLIGTIPVPYQGTTCNMAIEIHIPNGYSEAQPSVFMLLTDAMDIIPNKYVGPSGRVTFSYLRHWNLTCSINVMISQLIARFKKTPPKFSTGTHVQTQVGPNQIESLHLTSQHIDHMNSITQHVQRMDIPTSSTSRYVQAQVHNQIRPVHILPGHLNPTTQFVQQVEIPTGYKDKILRTWNVDDVYAWLNDIELGPYYADLFRKNGIDGVVLSGLTDEMLSSWLGIAALGHRNKILRKVKSLQMAGSEKLPDEFICPITKELMIDPVIVADGFTYDRASITDWIASGKTTSPMTNLPLAHMNLIPNRSLKSAIMRSTCE